MAAFDHVTLLLSFVFALALAHLLSRVANLVLARERVRFSGLLALAMVNAALLVFCNWLALWPAHDTRQWGLWSITCLFALAVTIYFICAMAAPEATTEGPIDMEAFYWRNRRPFYGMIALFAVVGEILVANSLSSGKMTNALLLAGNIPLLVSAVLPLVVPARWAQWAGGVALFVVTLAATIIFVGTLR